MSQQPPALPTISSRTPPPLPRPPLHWGFWTTLGFSVVIGIAFVIAQSVVVFTAAALTGVPFSSSKGIEALGYDADVLSMATIASTATTLGLIYLFIGLRKRSPQDYLLMKSRHRIKGLICVLATPALAYGLDFIASLVGEGDPEFMRMLYDSTNFLPLVLLSIVFLGPIAEEFLFRGFMFHAWKHSRIGVMNAALLSSGAWAAIHLQYSPFIIGQIFVLGLALSAAYHWTRSLWVPIVMHIVNNGLSMLSTWQEFG